MWAHTKALTIVKYINDDSNDEYMVRSPCEYVYWNVLPSIRKEFVRSLMRSNGFNQKQVAEILGVTPAAVCQYLSNKRGDFNIIDEDILIEIDKSVKNLLEHGSSMLPNETCRICRILRSKGVFSFPSDPWF